MTAILNRSLPYAPWIVPHQRRLPGVMPLPRADWLYLDDAYSAQMQARADLLATHRDNVLALLPEAEVAAQELLEEVLHDLPQHGFTIRTEEITRPDKVRIRADFARPLWTLGHLLQADFCILQKQGDEHVLTGAVLCFPSSWTLHEKLGKPLLRIHVPVESYDTGMGRRVQRMFDGMRPEQPLWRANLLRYTNPDLYQPRAEFAPKDKSGAGDYIRSERQCLLKLPRSGAVVFSIHTAQVHRKDLTPAQENALREIDASAKPVART